MARGKNTRRKRRGHWTPAGTLTADPHAPLPEIHAFAFGPKEFVEQKLTSIEWVAHHRGKHPVLWLDIDGLGDLSVLRQLGEVFDLHKLALEDVLHVQQRAKVDSYDHYHFIIMPMLHKLPGGEIGIEQLSMFLGKDFVLTFQEGIPGDCLDVVRDRLRKESAGIRERSADFLAYSLIDAVVDGYFPVLEDLGEHLEDLEASILLEPTKETVRGIHDAKRELLTIRRAVWPLREAINPLFRDDTGLVSAETKVYLRDCYDHCIQVIDLVETYRELGSSLMDVYLSSLSNKMNEVMKVLTIITTIFVPLTFVAGIYGMNFNTERSPLNMPELNAYWGYPLCLLAMLIVAALELGFFWKRGWIFQREKVGDLSGATGGERASGLSKVASATTPPNLADLPHEGSDSSAPTPSRTAP